MTQFYDLNGKEITVGARIAWPALSGRSCQLETGTVVELKPYPPDEMQKLLDRIASAPQFRFDRHVRVQPNAETEARWEREAAAEDAVQQHLLRSPFRVKVLPDGFGSRWSTHQWNPAVRPVTLTANASSVIVLDNETETREN